MKPGLVEGGIPDRVLKLLADGRRRALVQVVEDLRDDNGIKPSYGGVAQALLMFFNRGKLRRDKVRGKFVYWRDDVAAEAAS
jgi:hypothetical protein